MPFRVYLETIMQTSLDLTADIIDLRDIIERIEELESDIEALQDSEQMADQQVADETEDELQALTAIMAGLAGNGGDEQWRGDWYPLTLIRESYFEDYAQELAEDIGAVNRDATWPNNCIDWEQAARELRMDYSPITIDGVTYFYR
jgi:antirestriction protein